MINVCTYVGYKTLLLPYSYHLLQSLNKMMCKIYHDKVILKIRSKVCLYCSIVHIQKFKTTTCACLGLFHILQSVDKCSEFYSAENYIPTRRQKLLVT